MRQSPDERGKRFERLLLWLLDEVPDALAIANVTSDFGTEQIDVAVANRGGFRSLPAHFLVECKNYASPLDSKSVGYFLFICLSRGIELAVIVASSGLTGNAIDQKYAHSLAKAAAPMGCRLLILTRTDLLALKSREDLVDLLEKRYLLAMASGGVGI